MLLALIAIAAVYLVISVQALRRGGPDGTSSLAFYLLMDCVMMTITRGGCTELFWTFIGIGILDTTFLTICVLRSWWSNR